MSDFRRLSATMFASPQITESDIAAARDAGVALIINNRPDGEVEGQPSGADIERAAQAAGIGYCAIPVSHAGFSMPQVEAMADALANSEGPVLGYCRTGTRTTLLWAMAQAKSGMAPDAIAAAAASAGYDIAAVRPTVDMLASEAQG